MSALHSYTGTWVDRSACVGGSGVQGEWCSCKLSRTNATYRAVLRPLKPHNATTQQTNSLSPELAIAL